MKLDTDKEGLEAIFGKWQVPLIEEFFSGNPMTSGEAYRFLKEKGIKTSQGVLGTVSRASVINFLNGMIDNGLLEYTDDTGKGGHHRIYKMTLNREEFSHALLGRFVNRLISIFPQESKTFRWPRYSISLRGD